MYPIGKIACVHCMDENTEKENRWAYIIEARNDLVLTVKQNRLGHYKVECATKGRNETVEFTRKPKTKNGLFLSGKVRVTTPDQKKYVYTLDITNRICYYCYQRGVINYLPFSAGYYPAFVYSVIGKKSAGKTAFINSACFRMNAEDKMRAAKVVDPSIRLDPNQLADRLGLSEEIFIYDRKKRPVCTVILLDTPGELISGDDHGEDYEFHRNRIDMADAAIYVLERQEDSNYENENKWIELITNYETEHPVAVVMTKSDCLKEECMKNGGVICSERNGQPILTKDYFTFQVGMKNKSMKQKAVHMLRDKAIMRELAPVLMTVREDRKNIGYFLVSSGVPDADDIRKVRVEQSVNVTEPVKYLLALNGLYQYETKEKIDE